MDKELKKQTLKKLFNFASFQDHDKHVEDVATTSQEVKPFVDAAGGIVLARNLIHVSNEVFTQEYAPLTFLNNGIVVNNEGGYSTAIQKVKTAIQGEHRLAGDNTQTNGKISLSAEDDLIRVFDYEAESDYSETELKRALLQNVNLPSKLMAGHTEKWNYKIDAIGYLGAQSSDGTSKTKGLLNAGWNTDSADAKAKDMDAEALYAAIAGVIVAQDTQALGNETFTTKQVVMPYSVALECTKKTFSLNGGEKTVIQRLKTNFPQVTFVSTSKAEDVDGASVTIAFSNNRSAMQFRVPLPLKISNIHTRGFKHYFESHGSIAGLDILEESAATTLTGL